MIEVINGNVFHLQNNRISYVFYIMKNDQLGHLYFGNPLGRLSEMDIRYLIERNNKSGGTVKFSQEDGMFTLADQAQEYPVYGSSDFKEGAIDVFHENEPWYLDFKFVRYHLSKGKERQLAVPSAYAAADESETLTIQLSDEEHRLDLSLSFSIFTDFAVIAKNQQIVNRGQDPVRIQKMLSGVLELPSADYDFLQLSGAWLKERHIKRRKLEQGTVSAGSLKGASGHQHNPFIALVEKNADNNKGNVYAANLIYSGNFLGQVEVDEWDNTRLMIGINPAYFSWELNADESFSTPEALLFFSDQGLNGISNQTGRFAEKHIIDRKWSNEIRPIVFNNWEATYFDFDQKKLLALAKAGKDLGMECFVIDDGWFGKRDNAKSSLGDWYADPKKFPDGLGKFARQIHEMKLQLGIWFEPEMISPDSDLYRLHPEWVVKHPYSRASVGRGQFVLDFADPKVVDAIYGQLKKVILDTQLDYIKWDMNRNITEAYSNYLSQKKIDQTEFFHRYILGVYSLYAKILTDFPEILIEGCAGGGGRYDLGILFYSPQIWPSDDSDAVERLKIQSGTLLGYPLSSFSNHVSASPNHQIERITSLKMRQDVAMFGPLGYELNLAALSDHEKEEITARIAFYKNNRQLLTFGTFYQLIEVKEDSNEYAWAVFNEEKTEAVIAFFRILAKPNSSVQEFLKVPFICTDRTYLVNGQTVSGQVLKNIGIRKPYQFNGVNHDQAEVKGDFQSYTYYLKEKIPNSSGGSSNGKI